MTPTDETRPAGGLTACNDANRAGGTVDVDFAGGRPMPCTRSAPIGAERLDQAHLSAVAAFTLPTGQENTWLGNFGERWFTTICNAAGCPTGKFDPDAVDTDYYVHDHSHETIRVQVKTTEHPTLAAGSYTFSLPVKTYNRLREGNTPGYLALVVVHQPHPRWTRHFRRGAVVSAAVYWANLTGMGPTQNTSTTTMSLPWDNILTPESLLDLFGGGVAP